MTRLLRNLPPFTLLLFRPPSAPPLAPPLALLLALLLAPGWAAAHEVPVTVTVQVLVKPEGEHLGVLVRAPLHAMRDVELPLLGPGYLDLTAAEAPLRDAAVLWLADQLTFFEDGRRLAPPRLEALRVSLPTDGSFADFDTARAHLQGPGLPPDTELYWGQGLLDVLLRYDVRSADAAFAVDAKLAHLGLRTETVLRFLPPGGPERVYRYVGDMGRLALDPRWHQAVGHFVTQGFHHVLEGLDHLLFVFCLVIPFRRLKPLLILVTAFTVGHSMTLAAAALGMAPSGGWFPPLVETLIAASIVYMALENLLEPRLQRRWFLAFGFGLVHGFGFAFVLGESLQFAGSHAVLSLAAFNLGIEAGQLLVAALAVPAVAALIRLGVPRRFALIVLSVLVAHTGWHWMLERGEAFLAHPLGAPELNAAWWAGAMRWTMLMLAMIAVFGLVNAGARRLAKGEET